MAPPGSVPPGYSHDRKNAQFVDRGTAPPGADTNGRAYAMFFSFLGLAVALTAFIILNILKSYQKLSRSDASRQIPKRHIRLYAVLSVWSLLTVWYYEIQYFKISYQTWMRWRSYRDLTPDEMHWGLWLRDTSLFKEAWETAVVGNTRYWWTHQIFFFACGLGLSLEQKGIRRGIKHSWAFMLLGQIVSVGFATNLYLLSLLLSPPPPPSPSSTGVQRNRWLGPWLFSLLMIVFTEGPAYLLADEHYWFHQTDFLPMIITPHIALLFVPLARALLPSKFFTDSSVEFAGTVYGYLWGATILGGGLLFFRMTAMAYRYSGVWGIWGALFETPAVSSVAFDAIFCWIAWGAWLFTQKQKPGLLLKDREEGDGETKWTGGRSGQIEPLGDNNGVRRR